MDGLTSRKNWRTLEPYHGLIYFVPEATSAYAELGIHGRSGYFASRSAPMGAVPAEVVIATFFNFHPGLVREAMANAWSITTPAAILDARLVAADQAIRRILGDEVVRSEAMAEAATLARVAAESVASRAEGRALFAGHASLPWPDEPHLDLWHAISCLREYRGDGHIAAMTVEGIGGCEALVVHGATGDVAPATLQTSRSWPDDDWAEAVGRLQARGWIDAAGGLTADGKAHRQRVEDVTDALALPAWDSIGQDGADRLRELVRPFSRTIVDDAGVFRAAPA